MAVPMAAIPVGDRPRERLLTSGAAALSDRELLALLLRNGAQGLSALDLAGELLADFGGLQALAAARPEELAARRGVGAAKAAAIVAAFQFALRAGRDAGRVLMKRPADVAAVAMRELCGARRERVVVLVGDGANRLRHIVHVSDGAIDRSLMPVREVLNAVLRHDGRSFALVHNHPSGNPEPSNADRQATEEICKAAKVAGLRFLGHLVVTDDAWCKVT